MTINKHSEVLWKVSPIYISNYLKKMTFENLRYEFFFYILLISLQLIFPVYELDLFLINFLCIS